MYSTNLRSAASACQAALAQVPDGGRIVNIGANGAVKAGAGMAAYAASKAGVMRLAEALAEELKPRGITVNALLPSIIDTLANRKDMPDADPSTWVQPAQLAAAIVFLLSDEAGAITGALIPVVGRVRARLGSAQPRKARSPKSGQRSTGRGSASGWRLSARKQSSKIEQ